MSDATDPEDAYSTLQSEMSTVLIGNESAIEHVTIALLTGGHVLLEGVPGVAKTTLAETFARATGLDHSRIQLTPDTLPADITGTTIYREATGEFEVQKGPVFANVVVADEINRATPKTQSALLEAMQEGRVTIDGTGHELPDPFLVVATQNPIEMEGTFELPEAQRDRFQFKLEMELLERGDERRLLGRFDDAPELGPDDVTRVIGPGELPGLQETVAEVHVAEPVSEYLLDVAAALRDHPSVEHGPSPRASLAFQDAVKARAAIRGRSYVLPDDVKGLATPVLAHRLVLNTEATLSDVDPAAVVDDAVDDAEPPSAAAIHAASDAAEGTTIDGEST